jgi:hypothetical protein
MSKADWSVPTWYFFHGFAEKVNKEYYDKNYTRCFNIIREICCNLPCEVCRVHAVEKMNQTPDHMINTKEKLKDYLFNFHNEVSNRAGKQTFDKSILSKYTTFLPLQGYLYFTKCFFKPYHSINFNQWKRNMLLKKLNKELLSIWHELFK